MDAANDREDRMPGWGAENVRLLAERVREGVAVVRGRNVVIANRRLLELCGVPEVASLQTAPFADRFTDLGNRQSD